MDIIIPFHPKDIQSVRKCVVSCRVFVQGCRTIYLVSREDPCIPGTKWISEAAYPFTYDDIHAIMTGGAGAGRADRTGWYLQQLLKLYVDTIIPDLSEHFLIVDSDVVFRRRVTMMVTGLDGKQVPCYAYGREYYRPYFNIMSQLIPGLGRQLEDKSGVCHHMIFSRAIIREIRERIESEAASGQAQAQEPAWKIIMDAVDKQELSGFSEYELYFNYCIKYHPNDMIIRELRWRDAPYEMLDDNQFDYVAYHSWMRR